MKKLLAILGAISFTALVSTSVVACAGHNSDAVSIIGQLTFVAPTDLVSTAGQPYSELDTNQEIVQAVANAFKNTISTSDDIKNAVRGIDYGFTVSGWSGSDGKQTGLQETVNIIILGKGKLKDISVFQVELVAASSSF